MTHYFGDNQDYTLDTWSIKNIYLDFLDVLSNGDLIAHIGISDGKVDSSQFALNINNFLARIDQETGKIVWAYAYFFNEVGSQAFPYDFEVKNDIIWIFGHIINFLPGINDTNAYKKLFKLSKKSKDIKSFNNYI